MAGSNIEDAQKLLDEVEGKIAGGEALTIVRHIDLPDFFERFLSDAKLQHTPQTVLRFKSLIGHFSHFLSMDFSQVKQLAQLTPVVIESYKIYLSKTKKPKIVNLSILLLRDILEFGIKLGFLNDNPSLHVRLLAWPRTSERKSTARYQMAKQLLSKRVGLSKLTQLLKLSDISRSVYFAPLIPLSREDMHV